MTKKKETNTDKQNLAELYKALGVRTQNGAMNKLEKLQCEAKLAERMKEVINPSTRWKDMEPAHCNYLNEMLVLKNAGRLLKELVQLIEVVPEPEYGYSSADLQNAQGVMIRLIGRGQTLDDWTAIVNKAEKELIDDDDQYDIVDKMRNKGTPAGTPLVAEMVEYLKGRLKAVIGKHELLPGRFDHVNMYELIEMVERRVKSLTTQNDIIRKEANEMNEAMHSGAAFVSGLQKYPRK